MTSLCWRGTFIDCDSAAGDEQPASRRSTSTPAGSRKAHFNNERNYVRELGKKVGFSEEESGSLTGHSSTTRTAITSRSMGALPLLRTPFLDAELSDFEDDDCVADFMSVTDAVQSIGSLPTLGSLPVMRVCGEASTTMDSLCSYPSEGGMDTYFDKVASAKCVVSAEGESVEEAVRETLRVETSGLLPVLLEDGEASSPTPSAELAPHLMADTEYVSHFALLYNTIVGLEYKGDHHAALRLYKHTREDLTYQIKCSSDDEAADLRHVLMKAERKAAHLARMIEESDGTVYAYKIVDGLVYIPCKCADGFHRHGLAGLETDECYRISHCLEHGEVAKITGNRPFNICIRKGSHTRYMDHVEDPDLRASEEGCLTGKWQTGWGELVSLKEHPKLLVNNHNGTKAVKIHDKFFYTDPYFLFGAFRPDKPAYIYGQANASGTRIHWQGDAPGQTPFWDEWCRAGPARSEGSTRISDLESSDSERSAESQTSRTTMVLPARGMCFLSETLFETSTGDFTRADKLCVGQTVRGVGGQVLTVTSSYVHPIREREVVELRTAETQPLIVTADHRVVTQGSQGPEDRLAGDLTTDDKVICSDGRALRLEIAATSRMATQVVALKFSPDGAVAAMPPTISILTKGQVKRALRRSQRSRRNRVPSPGSYSESIPNTVFEYSD